MRYGMAIDLGKCVGCMACTIACKTTNYTRPGIFWNVVKDLEVGKYPSVRRYFLPTLCMHCESASCIEVCPTRASYRTDDGIVVIDYDKCVGCKSCIENCPYGARYFNGDPDGYFGDQLTISEKIGYKQHKLGVVEKCNFCVERLKQEKQPACVQTCVGKARYFGDLDDPNSEVSKQIKSNHGFQLHRECGTNPSVYYIPE